MEGLALEFVPGVGSLMAAILLLVVAFATIAYYGWQEERSRATAAAEREALKKAA